jgi:hypothetical protein
VVFNLDALTRGALGVRKLIFYLDSVAGTPGRAAQRGFLPRCGGPVPTASSRTSGLFDEMKGKSPRHKAVAMCHERLQAVISELMKKLD